MSTFYSILEIGEFSNAAEIKVAYRRLAMKYHPDKNNGNKSAEESFKKINEAYSVLSNPSKKAEYDLSLRTSSFNSNSFNTSRTYNRSSTTDFNSSNSWKDFFEFTKAKSKPNYGPINVDTSLYDISKEISISLEEAIIGCKKEISFDKDIVDPATTHSTVKNKKIEISINLRQSRISIIKEKNKVYFKLKVSKMGHESYTTHGIISGNLIITVNINFPENHYIENDEIIQLVNIPLSDILFEDENTTVTILDGTKYKVKVTNATDLSQLKFVIPNKGLLKDNNTLSNYIIRILAIAPDLSKLKKADKEQLKKLLS